MMQQITLEPTVIMRLDVEADTIGVVTAGEGDEEALVVFRAPDDARSFREHAGRYAPSEGFKLIGMPHQGIAALLERYALGWVVMPEGGIGAEADLFRADDFVAMLAESAVDA